MYELARCPDCVSQGVVWCTLPYGRRRRKKIYVAAAGAAFGLLSKASTRWSLLQEQQRCSCLAALSCLLALLLAAPLCLARSAAVGSPLTHAVTCCQSATAADLVSMRGSLAKMLLLGFTTLHTFPHCSAHVTAERHCWAETTDSRWKKGWTSSGWAVTHATVSDRK